MFDSVKKDIENIFQGGTMLNRLIVVNVVVFVALILVKLFTGFSDTGVAFYQKLISYLALSSDPSVILWRPWTLITHMFVHEGLFHIFWNMLLLHWFGRIVGDFLNDTRVLPIYILGGLFGGLLFVLAAQTGLYNYGQGVGASGAVLAFVWAGAALSPNYLMHLILIGPVKLIYIAGALTIIDLVSIAEKSNEGGHIAHLGGAIFGVIFVYALRNGRDYSIGFNKMVDWLSFKKEEKPEKKYKPQAKMKVTYVNKKKVKATAKSDYPSVYAVQERVDRILDKINEQGFDKLSDEEKEFLEQAKDNI